MPDPVSAAMDVGDEGIALSEEMARFLRWSDEAMKPKNQKSLERIRARLIQDLRAAGVPRAATRKITASTLRSNTVPKSLLARAGDKRDLLKSMMATARTSARGLTRKEWGQAFNEVMDGLGEAGVDDQILKELRRVGPERLVKVGPKQVTAAYAARGNDPILMRAFNRITKRSGSPMLPAEMIRGADGTKATSAARGALTQAGAKGMSTLGRAGRAAVKMPNLLGMGLQAYWSVPMLMSIFGGKKGRAEELMAQGMTSEGQRVTSAEMLRQVIEMQDAVAARRSVAMKREPQLTAAVLQAITGPQQQRMITPSQVAFGSAASSAQQAAPDKEAVLRQFDMMLRDMNNY